MSKSENLLEIWDTYSKNVLFEKKNTPGVGKKVGKGAKDLNSDDNKKFQHKDSGPQAADGFKPIEDEKPAKKKKLKEGTVKKHNTNINNNMKSNFDKLFEEVMGNSDIQDAEDLGVDVGEGEDIDSSDDTEDTVTVTLSPSQVDVLREILAQLDGSEVSEEDTDESSDEDLGDEELGDEDDAFGEATECEEIGHAIKDEKKLEKGLTGAKNNKVGNLKTNSGKADTKFTDKVGADGTLADSKGQSLQKPGSQKVASKLSKPGQDAFSV